MTNSITIRPATQREHLQDGALVFAVTDRSGSKRFSGNTWFRDGKTHVHAVVYYNVDEETVDFAGCNALCGELSENTEAALRAHLIDAIALYDAPLDPAELDFD